MRVALRRGEEPFVADEPVRLPAPARAERVRVRLVAAHVGAALLFGHAHADHHRAFLRQRRIARVVLACIELVAQRRKEGRFSLQHRNARERHRERAERAGFELRVQEIAGAARGHRARPRVRERQRVQPFGAQPGKQLVPARVEFECVDPLAARAVRRELGCVPVREIGEREHIGRRQRGAVVRERRLTPARAVPSNGLDERGIGFKRVVIGKRRRLVRHPVRRRHQVLLHAFVSHFAGPGFYWPRPPREANPVILNLVHADV
ncbi:Uncharacterised protein [Burkholderia pseudomallei]|nr:Uncharacterised protein [Burkholderia pseudomallei]